MTALTEKKLVPESERGILSVKMKNVKIFQGAHCMLSAGYANNSVATNATKGLGVAVETVDNSAGSDGDLELRVLTEKRVTLKGFSGLTQADLYKQCYASDNNTFTLTAANNIPVGKIVKVVSATEAEVELEAGVESGTV